MLYDTLSAVERLTSALVSDSPVSGFAPVNLYRDGDRYVLEADLPGVDPSSIDVSVDNGWLTVQAERTSSHESKDARWLVRERSESRFMRRFGIGDDVDVDKITAGYRNGVLRVEVPMAEEAKPRKIQVRTDAVGSSTPRTAIGAGSGETVPGEVTGKAEAAHSLAS